MKKEIIKAIRTMNYKEGVMPNILDEITKKATKEIIDNLDYLLLLFAVFEGHDVSRHQ